MKFLKIVLLANNKALQLQLGVYHVHSHRYILRSKGKVKLTIIAYI